MSEKPLPCPFCGSKNVEELGLESITRDFHCGGCGASVTWTYKPKDSALELWNRRSLPDDGAIRKAREVW